MRAAMCDGDAPKRGFQGVGTVGLAIAMKRDAA